jgi:hypothetical protein
MYQAMVGAILDAYLHPSDVAKLVKQLEGLVEAGNT